MLFFASFLIGVFIYCEFCEIFFYILDVSPLSDMWLVNIFRLSIACLSILLTGSFMEQSF